MSRISTDMDFREPQELYGIVSQLAFSYPNMRQSRPSPHVCAVRCPGVRCVPDGLLGDRDVPAADVHPRQMVLAHALRRGKALAADDIGNTVVRPPVARMDMPGEDRIDPGA